MWPAAPYREGVNDPGTSIAEQGAGRLWVTTDPERPVGPGHGTGDILEWTARSERE